MDKQPCLECGSDADHLLVCPKSPGVYAVKCDDCKAEMRRTHNVRESYAGGRCNSCRKD